MPDRVWQHTEPVPHIQMCEDVSGYSGDWIRGEVQRIQAAGTWNNLFAAGRSWNAAASKMDALRSTLTSVSTMLDGAWNSDDSVASQRAIQRLHTTAGNIAEGGRGVYTFADGSAAQLQTAVMNFPGADGGGGGEGTGRVAGAIAGTVVAGPLGGVAGSFVGGAIGGLFGGGPDPDELAREALTNLNNQYSAENTRLPYEVAAELPVIANPEGTGIGDDDWTEVGGYSPGQGPSGTSIPGPAPGTSGFNPGTVPGGPDGGGPNGIGTPGGAGPGPSTTLPAGPGDGFDPGAPPDYGGLDSAGPVPAGPGLGGLGPGGVGPGGVGPGGIGPGAPGVGGPGIGGGAAGVGPAGIGAIGGTGAAGRGGVGAAGARPGLAGGVGGRPGMAGGMAPMGAGGAAGGGAARGAGGRGGPSNPNASGGARAGAGAGRPGMAGGVAPMGGGRGAGDGGSEHDTWLVEDDDPWGGTDAPPGVIK